MRKLLAGLAALALCGCSTLAAVIPAGETAVATSNTVLVDATKALAVAADAYSAVADSITVHVKAGGFNATQLQMISTLNDRALSLIKGTDTSLTVAQRAASLMTIVTQLHSILGT